jgi:superfamily II DNA/RNA helicase
MDTDNTTTTKKFSDNVSVASRTKQVAYFVQQHDKSEMFMEVLKNLTNKQLLVLVKSKKTADALMDFLNKKELKSLAIHGNHRNSQIEEAQKAFNSKELTILITTDRILEKLALENIEAVVNYDLPLEASDYFMRLILVDEVGESISFINKEDEAVQEVIEYMMKSKIKEEKIENFLHTSSPVKTKKDKTKKPRHKKVTKRAKKEDETK